MTTIAFVFARGGSKGLPRKNLRLLAGKPLLAHAIEAAQAATLVDRVIVSTEDAEIAETARACGAEVLDRPAELATDDAPEWAAWQHAARSVPCAVFVSVPTTAPLRVPGDVDAVIRELQGGGCDAVMTVTPARRSPFFNQVLRCMDGDALLVAADMGTWSENGPLYRPPTRRQDAPDVFDCTTVAYAARPEFILSSASIWTRGYVRTVIVPLERALDIDTELDLRIAEASLQWRGHCAGCGETFLRLRSKKPPVGKREWCLECGRHAQWRDYQKRRYAERKASP